ncbi:diguanylate cyclase [Pseudomonas sp. 8Z]|uniref:GGDEF domain-containing protein n=1 Tax=Pseudomonas sp. 8Z TaxID=2653166 RepID=UPI00135B254B|nr:GGDEF domain-containing protein [Pseudomonas sp. 8Z]
MPQETLQAFEQWYRLAKIAQIRYVAFLTAALYLIYAAIEQSVADDLSLARLIVHGLLVPGALLLTAFLSFRPQRQALMLGLLTVAPVLAVLANLYFNFGTPNFAVYAPEIYLNLIWTFSVAGLALKRAMVASLMSLSAIVLVTFEPSLAPGPQRLHLIWVLASFSFGFLSAFILERAHKLMFLHQDRLELSANLDGLTGLWNRLCTERFLAEQAERANRYGTRFSVALIDIDHFKSVNDTHGHAVGDVVLCQFAALLRENVRSVDKVGRLGGEEFLIVLPEIGAPQAELAVRALRQRINGFIFDTVQRKTASVGIAEYCPGESLQDLLLRADQAMYKAKAKGRDCIEVL